MIYISTKGKESTQMYVNVDPNMLSELEYLVLMDMEKEHDGLLLKEISYDEIETFWATRLS